MASTTTADEVVEHISAISVPVQRSDRPTDGVSSNEAYAPIVDAVESSVVTKDAGEKVCVLLKAESFEIKTGGKSQRRAGAEPVAYLICDNVMSTSASGGVTTLKCTNCELKLPNGITASADDVVYDSKLNVLTLTGSDETPVTVSMADTVSKCAKLEMKFNPRSWAAPAPLTPATNAVSSRY